MLLCMTLVGYFTWLVMLARLVASSVEGGENVEWKEDLLASMNGAVPNILVVGEQFFNTTHEVLAKFLAMPRNP